jgi:hypothetical protein
MASDAAAYGRRVAGSLPHIDRAIDGVAALGAILIGADLADAV